MKAGSMRKAQKKDQKKNPFCLSKEWDQFENQECTALPVGRKLIILVR